MPYSEPQKQGNKFHRMAGNNPLWGYNKNTFNIISWNYSQTLKGF
jgi:hypothetical protein